MRLRAFVFDDDEAVRSLIASVLVDRGYEVEAFADPANCPLMLDDSCPCPYGHACSDVIISDIHMPSISGLDFLETQKRKGCKVENMALISGDWSYALRNKASSMGIRLFDKPFRIAELTGWLEECEKRIKPDRVLSKLSDIGGLRKPQKISA